MFKKLMKLFSKSINLYVMNFHKYFTFMAFPVLGQVLGIVIILGVTYLYTVHIPLLTQKFVIFDNVMLVLLLFLLLVLPGFFIFCKAFWDYMVSFISLNTMANSLIVSGQLSDVMVHKELARRRTGQYVLLLLVMSLIYLVFALPIFWIFGIIFFIYEAVVFQVFALEENTGVGSAMKGSFDIVKTNIGTVVSMLLLMGVTTYLFLPYAVQMFSDFFGVTYFFSKLISPMFENLPLQTLNDTLATVGFAYRFSPVVFGEMVYGVVLSSIVVGFTLPLRCLGFTAIYKDATNEYGKLNKPAKKAK